MIFSCILLTLHSSRKYRNDVTLPSAHSLDPRHMTHMNRLLFVNEALVHKSYIAMFSHSMRWVGMRLFKKENAADVDAVVFSFGSASATPLPCLLQLEFAGDAAGAKAGLARWNCSGSGGHGSSEELKRRKKRWNLASSLGSERFLLARSQKEVPRHGAAPEIISSSGLWITYKECCAETDSSLSSFFVFFFLYLAGFTGGFVHFHLPPHV